MQYDPRNLGVKQPFAVLPPEAGPGQKNRRILRVVWWTLPLAGLAFIIGAWLVGLAIWGHVKASSANEGSWESAASAYDSRVLTSRVAPETWLTDYNAGTALLHLGDIDEGISRLGEAFEGVPKAVPGDDGALQPYSYECQVRMNISAGFELQGDETASSDEASAIELYEEALEWVSPCQIGGAGDGDSDGEPSDGEPNDGEPSDGDEGEGGEDGEPSDQFGAEPPPEGNPGGEATDRLEDKIRDLKGENEDAGSSEPKEGTGEEGRESQFGNETESEREKREELEQKNQDQQERQREKDESKHRNPGTGGW